VIVIIYFFITFGNQLKKTFIMKKLLLLGAMVLGSLFTAHAQVGSTCATPATVTNTTSNPITAPNMTGTYVPYCLASNTNIKARWYKYDATANGEVTISSDLPQNNGTTYTNDTRVSVIETNNCSTTTFTCIATADDVSSTNFKTTLTFPVQAGKTYHIQWDSYWNGTSTLGFQWTFAFNAVSCVRPGQNSVYLPGDYTTTSAVLAWNNAIGSPSSYDIDWSTNIAAAAGTGTIVPITAATATPYTLGEITGLPASANFRYYIRSNCGFTQSGWQGPYYGYLPKVGSFNHNFNTAADPEDGFIGDFALFYPSSTSTLLSYTDGSTGGSVYSFNDATAASDEWSFSRGIYLSEGQVVSIKYKTRLYPATGTTAPMSLRVTAGLDQIAASQTQVLQAINPTGNADFTQNTTPNWTVPASGVYYFGFHNNSAANATSTAVFLDTIEITVTGTAGTNDVLASTFAVFPNPASNVITVSGKDALVNGVELIDLNGRTVKALKVNNVSEAQINISDLSAGVYMMNISSDKGVTTKKIVKQ